MSLLLSGIKKHYPDFEIDVSFTAENGEILTLLGPSGCGKTTTLHIIAGFIKPDEGMISLNQRDLIYIPVHLRNVGLVFQDYALFPHMNVFGNIAFGLRMQGCGKREMEKRVRDLLSLIRLPGYEKRIVTDLSGGEQQRVALARALAPNPDILLLDEPLSALDTQLRKELRKEIKRIQRELKLTTIYVTHDQEEALAISDKIVIMNKGSVEQSGRTYDVYTKPDTRFVANFIGITNMIDAQVRKSEKDLVTIESAEGIFSVRYSEKITPGSHAVLLIRPEKCKVSESPDQKNRISGKITGCEFLGDSTVVSFRSDNNNFTAKLSDLPACKTGDFITVTFSPDDGWILKND